MYHAIAFKPVTLKIDKFTNFWMHLQMTGSIFQFNSILNIRTQPPARLEHGQLFSIWGELFALWGIVSNKKSARNHNVNTLY